MYGGRGLLVLAGLFFVPVIFIAAVETENACEKPPTKCPKNELFIRDKVEYPPDTCDSLWIKYACAKNQKPKPGCRCKKGYLRTNSTGVCIPKCDCVPPPKCEKLHEKYTKCLAGQCIPKTCDDLGKPIPCPEVKEPCEGGCICEDGYVRDCKGRCIKKEDCPSCGGDPNAITGCGNHCGNSCSDHNRTVVCPLFCIFNGCNCRPGFVYDANIKKCVRKEDCTPTCNGPHEKYIDCLAGQCIPKTCEDLVMPIPCPKVKPPCPGGCICEDGYVRNCDGICIKKEDCPSCGGDCNAVSGCGNHCGKSCSDYNKSVACPLFCLENGCDCRPGFVYDAKVKKCVKKKDCSRCTKKKSRKE